MRFRIYDLRFTIRAAALARISYKLVAQICNLPYRRLAACRASTRRSDSDRSTNCRLQVGDTADCKSALRCLRAGSIRRTCEIFGLVGVATLGWSQEQPMRKAVEPSVSAPAVGVTNVHGIDLATALRLAGAPNLDVQIARERLAEAKANHAIAMSQFFPWLAPGLGYRRHEDRLQDVVGNVFDADKQSYLAGGTLAAQWDLGDAI